jgi:hypothetical protein
MSDDAPHRIDSDRNRAMLDKWYKRSIWGAYGNSDDPTEAELNKRCGGVTGYMLRMLSRGQVPNPDVVFDTLSGKLPVPGCGIVGCFIDFEHFEHVH